MLTKIFITFWFFLGTLQFLTKNFLVKNVLDTRSNIIGDRHYRVTERGCSTQTEYTHGPMNLTQYHNLTVFINTYKSQSWNFLSKKSLRNGRSKKLYVYLTNISIFTKDLKKGDVKLFSTLINLTEQIRILATQWRNTIIIRILLDCSDAVFYEGEKVFSKFGPKIC